MADDTGGDGWNVEAHRRPQQPTPPCSGLVPHAPGLMAPSVAATQMTSVAAQRHCPLLRSREARTLERPDTPHAGVELAVSDGRWVEVTPSEHAHERAALNFLRERLPDRDPYRYWSNFTFQAEDGRRYEVDLLIVTPTEVFLVEIKSHPNRMDGDAGTWVWTTPDGKRRSFDNPLRLAGSKAKKLKSLLEHQDALKDAKLRNRRGPDGRQMRPGFFVREVVFLSDPTLKVGLDELGRTDVYGPDPDSADKTKQRNDLPGLVARVTDVPAHARNRIDKPLSTAIAKAMDQVGIRQSQALRQAGHYRLDELLTDGDVWQDFLAQAPLTKDPRRIRLYLTSRAQTEEERQALARAAKREYDFLRGIDHPGIERPYEVLPNPQGPALVFPHDPQAVRLDHYLDEHREELDLYDRIELVRQLAETLRAAHRAGLYHRALAPQHVAVTATGDGAKLRIRDWQAAVRELTAMATSIRAATGTSHVARLVTEQAHLYVAPEVIRLGESNPRAADMWSLGAVSYLILTGEPPAADTDGLYATLKEHESLTLAAAMDAPDPTLDLVVRYATRTVATDRFVSVDEFLEFLDVALDELTSEPVPDPLDAKRGDELGDWKVQRRFGSGSTSVVLQVERDGRTEVLKVARDEDHAARLRDEAEALAQLEEVRSPTIVRAYGLESLGGRTALRLEAAYTTLARLLEQDGPLSIDRLERFGQDLLDALQVLEQEGVAHRDIKPDNLGVIERGKNKERRLVLFDFSLSRADAANLHAGTAAYLDPFLQERPEQRWDLQAERYAAAVTLHEMATGQRPQWGDGATDPLLLDGIAAPTLFLDVVDPSIRGGLVDFLTRALARDPAQRFDTAADMRRAFDRLFTDVDAPATPTDQGVDPADVDLGAVTEDTALTDLGLAPRIVNVFDRLGTLTAGDLARIPPHELSRLSGVGASVRRQIADLADRLRRELADVEVVDDTDVPSIDRLVAALVPKGPATDDARIALQAFLGLVPTPAADWPSQRQVAEQTEIDRAEVAAALGTARDRWRKRPELTAIRHQLAELLAARDGVAGGDELGTALLATRGSLEEEPVRTRRARAVVRAALETEATLKQPRFTHRRIGEVLLVALDGPTTLDDGEEVVHDADALFDLAAELGEVADTLAAEEPLPPPDRVVAALREVPTPFGQQPMTDARLVRLAAAASTGAAVSSRLELYPIGMDAVRAVAEARGALLARGGLSVKDVRARVTARFPRAAALPNRPSLDQLLADAGTGLVWQAGESPTDGRYVHPDRGGVLATSYLTGSGTGSTSYASPDERELAQQEVDDRLDRIVRDGGFLALTVARSDLDRAAQTVAARTHAAHVDLDTWLIEEMRAAAADAGGRWDAFLTADADPEGSTFRHVRTLIGRAVPKVVDRLAGHAEVVVGTGLGLLARYGHLTALETTRDQLTRHRSDQVLRGLIVVVPGVDPGAMPALDGHPIPVITANQWAHLPSAWLTSNTGAAA